MTWSLERRLKQREMIQKWRPWEKSSGPKTLEGKTHSCMNAYKDGAHNFEVRAALKLIACCRRSLRKLEK